MSKVLAAALLTVALVIGLAMALASPHANATPLAAHPSSTATTVAGTVRVTFPCPSEDSSNCYVAYVTQNHTMRLYDRSHVTSLTAGPKSYGDYYSRAWHLVIYPLLASPHASATPLAAHPSPVAKTCAAYRAWTAHRTTARLDAMVVASLAAPWGNLGNDVDVVYADVRAGNRTDLAGDVAGIRQDCKGR